MDVDNGNNIDQNRVDNDYSYNHCTFHSIRDTQKRNGIYFYLLNYDKNEMNLQYIMMQY